MKNICFYFQVHQPFRLRNYKFFDIGNDNNYFDEQANSSIMRKVAQKCYLPANATLLELIKEHGDQFKVSFSISGTALDQFERYAPEVLESFRKLANTGCVEFLAETYSHSLSALKSKAEFVKQVNEHVQRIEKLFGVRPTVFRNTELIYSNQIGHYVDEMGFKGMLTEGADRILGWKSPNYVYHHADQTNLKLLLKNFRLSDDIAFRFSQQSWGEWPLTADKFVYWLNAIPEDMQLINLFMDYETFGEHQWEETGIFNFLKALPRKLFSASPFKFITPSEAISMLEPVASLDVPHPISWADEERDLSAWLGNDLQDDAFDSLYRLEKNMETCSDTKLLTDWKYLQTSDHFYYMCTKYFADGDVHKYFNHYDSPYDAFVNYMNVLSDFEIRVNEYWEGQKQYQIPEHINELLSESLMHGDEAKVKIAEKKEKVLN